MMRVKLLAMVTLVGGLGFAAIANAAPFAPPSVGIVAGRDAQTTDVAYGCGPGFTRGPYGGCRPIYVGYRYGYGGGPGY
jgi:hypothetical protein